VTGGNERSLERDRPSDPAASSATIDLARERRDHATTVLSDTLEQRDATAFVHVGTDRDPGIQYICPTPAGGVTAVAYDGVEREWLVRSAADGAGGHPADRSPPRRSPSARARGRGLAPPRVPHDAALYLEGEGFELASADALERARTTKTDGERERISRAQRAASAGIRRAASVLADATVVDGRLATAANADAGSEPEFLTPARLRIAIDEAIVGAGAFPVGTTAVNPDSSAGTDAESLRPGEPIVLETAPRGPAGYYGGLDSDAGRRRRRRPRAAGLTSASLNRFARRGRC